MSDPVRRGRPEAAAAIWSWRDRDALERARLKALRRGGVLRAVVAVIAASVLAFFERPIMASIAIGIGLLTLVLALVSPGGAYASLSRGVDRVGALIGAILTYVLLTPVFFLFFLPFGMLMRRGARDRLRRRFERERASYWTKRAADAPGSLERPY
ncbi:MAG: hypothetical protein M3Y87_22860 [Myxococcota bacterium]|nr:hypothetical protein [Myxococcota bacterium]